jgi:leucyl-tRNA synthetase
MQAYNHNEIEKKWQKKWEEDGLNTTQEKGDKKFYILDMFPYPSGEGLHVGHPKGYIATDVYSRLKRMQGYDVLHPMGFDAFGLPAEQYALKNKVNPNISTAKNVARYKEQLQMLGLNYDWDREVNTTDPKFYKWTQWMWKQMYKKGLAYESYDPINWCPSCKTGLANEDLENGLCERCGSVVEKKPLRQWTIRITDYADRLLADIDKLDWEPHIKELQRNWISTAWVHGALRMNLKKITGTEFVHSL